VDTCEEHFEIYKKVKRRKELENGIGYKTITNNYEERETYPHGSRRD
jgi:hypothetical protein